jgi:hypothetical protein
MADTIPSYTHVGFLYAGYVGFSPSQDTVIVAHQGTDTSEL